MESIYSILLQSTPAITNNGSISAEWVLVGVVTLATILAGIMLNDIRSSIKSLITKTGEHSVSLATHEERINSHDSSIQKMHVAIEPKRLANDIANELRSLNPKVKYYNQTE